MACRFFGGKDPVHNTLRKITGKFDNMKIPYAVAGGMALVAHGYRRLTLDVDIVLSASGLNMIHEKLVGAEYVLVQGRIKSYMDAKTGVRIDILLEGDFPGDGKPKPVAFPNPSTTAVVIDGISYLTLRALLDLKIASGISNRGRMKDLGDAQELIKVLKLSATFSDQLHPFVREKYAELWRGAAEAAAEDQ